MNRGVYKGWHYYANVQLIHENEQLRHLIQSYNKTILKLDRKVQRLSAENKVLREFLHRLDHPVKIENLHLSDVNLENLKVNSLQSGAALNIGEHISSETNSDMDMKMGSNSMNSGDHNHMDHHIEYEPEQDKDRNESESDEDDSKSV